MTPAAHHARLLARRAASCAVRAALRLRSRPLEASSLGPVLVVAPHPDDETFGCGGTLALLAAGGRRPSVAFVTDGGGSHPSHPALSRADVSALRRREALSALGALGVGPGGATFLDAADGTLAHLGERESAELVGRIAAVLVRLGPAAVLLPCRIDGSSEHDAAFALVRRSLREAAVQPRVIEYPVWSWWNPLRLVGPMLAARAVWRVDLGPAAALKARAIAAYASQTHAIPPEASPALPAGFALMFQRGEEFFLEHPDPR